MVLLELWNTGRLYRPVCSTSFLHWACLLIEKIIELHCSVRPQSLAAATFHRGSFSRKLACRFEWKLHPARCSASISRPSQLDTATWRTTLIAAGARSSTARGPGNYNDITRNRHFQDFKIPEFLARDNLFCLFLNSRSTTKIITTSLRYLYSCWLHNTEKLWNFWSLINWSILLGLSGTSKYIKTVNELTIQKGILAFFCKITIIFRSISVRDSLKDYGWRRYLWRVW